MSWFSEAVRDENGLGDIAYGGLAWVTFAVLGSIFFLMLMEVWALRRCVEVLAGEKPILCRFNGESFGTAVGYICGGYAASLAALAGYMAATRRQPGGKTTMTTRTTEVEAAPIPPAAVAAMAAAQAEPTRGTPAKPIHVAIEEPVITKAAKPKAKR